MSLDACERSGYQYHSWVGYAGPVSSAKRNRSQSSTDPEPPTCRHESLKWAELLRRTYAFEVLVCEVCGARREMIAFLTAPISIRHVVEHLGLPTRPPPIRYAPAALCRAFTLRCLRALSGEDRGFDAAKAPSDAANQRALEAWRGWWMIEGRSRTGR